MIPPYNSYGALPEGIFKPQLKEFKDRYVKEFVGSSTRPIIYKGFIELSMDQLRAGIFLKQWIDGSYITSKEEPNDIDMVTFFNGIDHRIGRSQVYSSTQMKERYHCDSYIAAVYPENDPRFSLSKDTIEYWRKWWGHDRNNRLKGFIEFDLNAPAHKEAIEEEASTHARR
jgi:hypothetical protein